MRIHLSSLPFVRKPQAGDEKVVKGITYIRQQEYSQTYKAYVVSNGRPVWEWVEKGGERDRSASIRKWRLDNATMNGNSNRERVACELCGDPITLETDFEMDEDGRSYCYSCSKPES